MKVTKVTKVWGVCVFPKTRQLNRFVRKWDMNPSYVENSGDEKCITHSNKRYRMIKMAPWGVKVAVCVQRNLAASDRDIIKQEIDKVFCCRELLLFSLSKATPEYLAAKLRNVDALSEEETYLIYDLMELPLERPSDKPPTEFRQRKRPAAPILPSIFANKKFIAEESIDRNADSLVCAVCSNNRKTETMMPCGCMAMCFDCLTQCGKAGQLDTCILCRAPVFGIQHTTW